MSSNHFIPRRPEASVSDWLLPGLFLKSTAEPSVSRANWGAAVRSKPADLRRLLTLLVDAANLPLVLLVDDDADLCANLWDLLWERGFRVSIAHSTRTAGALLRDGCFKVVLIDMRIPVGDGAEVLRMVQQFQFGARIVLITGHGAELAISLERLREEGADAICYKPFDVPELLATIERLSRP